MLAALQAIWSFRRFVPYVVIALLVGWHGLDRARLHASQRETQTTKNELLVATAANASDQTTIAAQRKALQALTSQLGQANAAAAAAADTAAREALALSQRLAAAQKSLSDLQKDPAYAAFLATDLDALYPDIARGLRSIDAAGQD